MNIKDWDRPPFFYFVENGEIVATSSMPSWSREGATAEQEKHPECQMWAYRYRNWIKYDRFHGVFDIRFIKIPDCLKLVILLEE